MLLQSYIKLKMKATAQEYYSCVSPPPPPPFSTNMPHICIEVEILSNLKDNNSYNQFLKLSAIENGPNC
jgi:hypothetical protein